MIKRYSSSIIVGVIMAVVGIVLVITGADYAKIMAAVGGVVAMSALPFIERKLEVRFPLWLQLCYSIFIVAALLLGTIVGMYGIWWPWDGVLHLTSGVLIAGFGIVLLSQRFGRLHVVLPVSGRIILIGMFSATIAFLWEVAEFASDSFLGTFSQNNDVRDTMLDMIFGTTTGTLTAAVYYLYMQKPIQKVSESLSNRKNRRKTPKKA